MGKVKRISLHQRFSKIDREIGQKNRPMKLKKLRVKGVTILDKSVRVHRPQDGTTRKDKSSRAYKIETTKQK
jgi:hypothetical protein